jgi:transcriptional regulator with XRE-family HTH domain
MTFAEYRARRGVSLEACCTDLGLAPGSKGHLSRMERGVLPFGFDLALRIESWSGGEVRAIDLLTAEDAQLLRAAIARAAQSPPQPEEISA